MVSNWTSQTQDSAPAECPQVNLILLLSSLHYVPSQILPPCLVKTLVPSFQLWSPLSLHPCGEPKPKTSSFSTPLTITLGLSCKKQGSREAITLHKPGALSHLYTNTATGQRCFLAHMKSFQISHETLQWFLFHLCYATWPSICYPVLPAFHSP